MRERRLAEARWAARIIERFVYGELSAAETPEQESSVRNVQRLVVGIRRQLDNYHVPGAEQSLPSETKEI